jgi:regulator of protease activity HflC (stomatin/prohibitin superfamily)
VGAGATGPGLIFVFPPVQTMTRVSLRQEAMEVPSQDIITRDNVTLKVNAVITFYVQNPTDAVIKVSNYIYQTSQFAQTTLRSVLGEVDLDQLLAHRDTLNQRIQTIIDGHTAPFGVKVVSVEVKQVDMPESMLRAMAKQAEAERERRAKVVNAEGEFQAAEKMVQAAGLIAKEPIALQLRYLQTMREMASEHNTTTFLPLPIDLFSAFLKK